MGGIKFVLYPMAKEILHNAHDLPVSRKELDVLIEDAMEDNPKIKFDMSLMPTEQPNTWFIDILQNEELKKKLMEKINAMEDGAENMENVYDAVMDLYREGKGVEGNQGVYDRAMKMKEMLLKEEMPTEEGKKVLIVTHSRIMTSLSAKGFEKGDFVDATRF